MRRRQRASLGGRAEGRGGGSVGPGGRGPLERLRTWERPGPGRPLGAGGDLALGPWRRGRPGLAQRRRLQEARSFGLRRRRLVPRPLSRPRSVRETSALRPAPSAAQAPAPAPTSTWGPIETVRHAPPPPPGAAAAALGEDSGGGAAGRLSPRRSLRPHGGGGRRVPAGLLSAAGGRSARQLKHPPNPPLRSARPQRIASAFRFSPQIRLSRLRRGGDEGGSQRPPAARRPRARRPRLLPFAAGGRAAAAQQAGGRAAPRPRGPGGGPGRGAYPC